MTSKLYVFIITIINYQTMSTTTLHIVHKMLLLIYFKLFYLFTYICIYVYIRITSKSEKFRFSYTIFLLIYSK